MGKGVGAAGLPPEPPIGGIVAARVSDAALIHFVEPAIGDGQLHACGCFVAVPTILSAVAVPAVLSLRNRRPRKDGQTK